MADTKDSQDTLNKILALVHPQLYQDGLAALEGLQAQATSKDIASQWSSVYSGISVIANRLTKAHCDNNAKPSWYDLLVALGSYASTRLRLAELGLELEYTPGTVVPLCGNVFTHEVGDWGDGDRLCYAQFMREAVIDRFQQGTSTWMTQGYYQEEVSDKLAESSGLKA